MEKVDAWKCRCGRVFAEKRFAQDCEKKHDKFSKLRLEIKNLFDGLFPVIATRYYFVYDYGKWEVEKIALLGYRLNEYFEKGIIEIKMCMVINRRICEYACKQTIEVNINDPLAVIKEFLEGLKELSFISPTRTHIDAEDWLSIPKK